MRDTCVTPFGFARRPAHQLNNGESRLRRKSQDFLQSEIRKNRRDKAELHNVIGDCICAVSAGSRSIWQASHGIHLSVLPKVRSENVGCASAQSAGMFKMRFP